MLADVLNEYPEIIAIALVVAGFVLAGLFARLVERMLTRIQASLLQRPDARLEARDLEGLIRGTRAVVYYGTLLIFALLALQTLSVDVIRDWLSLALEHVPQLILGGLIILSGYLLAVVVRNIIAGVMGVSQQHLAPRLAQGLVFVAAVLTGLAQTAINVSFLTDIVIILIAFFFGGLSLAFALGSRQLVENLLARRALDRYRIGDLVRLNDLEGRIVEMLGTAVVLESSNGIITIPTSRFVECEVTLVKEEADSGDQVT